MFKKICIIGCGLIGSSLARAIKKNALSDKIVSSNRSNEINKKVIELERTIQLQEEAYKTNVNLAKILRVTAVELSKSNSYEEILQDQNIEFSKSKNNLIKIPIISFYFIYLRRCFSRSRARSGQ